MESNKKKRKEIIKARVTEEEKELIRKKSDFYGYRHIANYIRDAAVYEKVTYVDLENRKLIYDAYSENTKAIKELVKQTKHLCKYLTQVTDTEVRDLKGKMYRLIRLQQDMYKLIEKKLELKIWQERNE